jgi:predicted transcriptional regulator
MTYNVYQKQKKKNYIKTLAIEAETAVSQLDLSKQNYYRHAVAINLNKLIKKEHKLQYKNRREWNIIKR